MKNPKKNKKQKNHGNKRKKFTMSKIGTIGDICEQLQQKHNDRHPKNFISLQYIIIITKRMRKRNKKENK